MYRPCNRRSQYGTRCARENDHERLAEKYDDDTWRQCMDFRGHIWTDETTEEETDVTNE